MISTKLIVSLFSSVGAFVLPYEEEENWIAQGKAQIAEFLEKNPMKFDSKEEEITESLSKIRNSKIKKTFF